MVSWEAIAAILFPNVGGWASAYTMMGHVKRPDGQAWYQTIRKPRWNPPNGVFGPAWTALYSGMGFASYMVYRDCGGFTDDAALPLALYGGQLALNFAWSPVFFKHHKIGLALINMVLLDVMAAACTYSFHQVNPQTAYFMLPYLAWLSFATSLNFAIWRLNRKTDKNDD